MFLFCLGDYSAAYELYLHPEQTRSGAGGRAATRMVGFLQTTSQGNRQEGESVGGNGDMKSSAGLGMRKGQLSQVKHFILECELLL